MNAGSLRVHMYWLLSDNELSYIIFLFPLSNNFDKQFLYGK